MAEKKNTICIGDLHGHIHRLRNLWHNLELTLTPPVFQKSTVIFLGDYNDRGPDTSQVLDFLISLPQRYPEQTHVFLCGNHDFAFAAFVNELPNPPVGFEYSSTWEEFKHNEDREGWWSGPGEQDIHVQGRRWAGNMTVKFNAVKGVEYQGSIYDARPTFESYGVSHGDRAGLLAAVPKSHKDFLRNLVWVHEQEGEDTGQSKTSYTKMIAVHAGLESSKSVNGQLQFLQDRNITAPRIEPLAGRKNVWNTPPGADESSGSLPCMMEVMGAHKPHFLATVKELEEKGVLVVSGHHAHLHIEDKRLIIDESGGLDHLPIAAIILPSRVIVRDTDSVAKHELNMPLPVSAAH